MKFKRITTIVEMENHAKLWLIIYKNRGKGNHYFNFVFHVIKTDKKYNLSKRLNV